MASIVYLSYYQRNKESILSKAKEYYKNNKGRLSKQARERYNNLSEEERTKGVNMIKTGVKVGQKKIKIKEEHI